MSFYLFIFLHLRSKFYKIVSMATTMTSQIFYNLNIIRYENTLLVQD